MSKLLNKMVSAMGNKKGEVIMGVVMVALISGVLGYKAYRSNEAAKVEAIQQAKEDAQTKKDQDAYTKQKADAAAKVIADAKAEAAAKAAVKAAATEAAIARGGRSISAIYTEMHTMANSIVIADDVWEQKQITKINIQALSNEIQAGDYATDVKAQLLTILHQWGAGDFSKAASEHNYVWGKLDGNTGRATGVDNSKLPSWAIIHNK